MTAAVSIRAPRSGDRPQWQHLWSACLYCHETCRLQDLHVDPAVRGSGPARALIEAVCAAAGKAGLSEVCWLTQDSNAPAHCRYDRIGQKIPVITYGKPL